MIKKIVLWSMYGGVVGLLVFGAVNRTEAKADAGTGQAKSASESNDYQTNRQEYQGDGLAAGLGSGQPAEIRRRGADSVSEFDWETQANEEDHVFDSLRGTVKSISEESVEIELATGEILLVEGQAWRYALSAGFNISRGNRVEVTGFDEGDEFKVSLIRDLEANVVVELRDQSGRPFWSGRYK